MCRNRYGGGSRAWWVRGGTAVQVCTHGGGWLFFIFLSRLRAFLFCFVRDGGFLSSYLGVLGGLQWIHVGCVHVPESGGLVKVEMLRLRLVHLACAT